MEIKHNDATINRPMGERVIDAPFVYADLTVFINQVKDENAWEKSDRNSITVFKSDGMTIVLSAFKEGAVIKDNVVKGFLTVHILEGTVKMETLGGDGDITENQLMVFHPGVPHSIEARTNAVFLITTAGMNGESPE